MALPAGHQDTYNYQWAEAQNGASPDEQWRLEDARKKGLLGMLPPWLVALITANGGVPGAGTRNWPTIGGGGGGSSDPAASPYGPSIGPAPGTAPADSLGSLPTDPRQMAAALAARAASPLSTSDPNQRPGGTSPVMAALMSRAAPSTSSNQQAAALLGPSYASAAYPSEHSEHRPPFDPRLIGPPARRHHVRG